MADMFQDIAKVAGELAPNADLLKGLADQLRDGAITADDLRALLRDVESHAPDAALPGLEITDKGETADTAQPATDWNAATAQVQTISTSLDSMESQATTLLQSADPADQARGQAMMDQTQQVMETVSTAIQQQGDAAKDLIQNAADSGGATPATAAPAADPDLAAVQAQVDKIETQTNADLMPAVQHTLDQAQAMADANHQYISDKVIGEHDAGAASAAPAIVEGQSDADVVQTTADHDVAADRADTARSAALEVSVAGQASSTAAAQASAAQAQAAEAATAAAAGAATTTDDRDSHGVSRAQAEQHAPIVDAAPAEATAQADHPAEDAVAEAVTPEAAAEPAATPVEAAAAPDAAPAEHVETAAPAEDHTAAAPAEDHSAGADAAT